MKQKTLDLKHFFYIDLSSNEFKKIIKKYKSNKPNSNEHLNFNLIQAFEQQRKEVENKETDEDFMLRDLKQLRKIENELLNNYGLKSKEEIHHIPQSKFVTKLDKSRFNNLILNLKKNNQNNIQYFNKFKYKKKKNNNNNNENNNNNNNENNNNNNENNNENNNNNNNKKNNKRKSVIKLPFINNKNKFNPDSSFYSQMPLDKSINATKENLLTINNDYNNNENSFLNNKINQSQRLDSIRENYYSFTDGNNNNKSNNKYKNIKRNYIQILNNEKNNFTNEKKKYQKLFDNNDYGYKRSKIKYNYLIEKYF